MIKGLGGLAPKPSGNFVYDGCDGKVTSRDRNLISQQSSTPVRQPILKIENWATVGGVLSEIIGRWLGGDDTARAAKLLNTSPAPTVDEDTRDEHAVCSVTTAAAAAAAAAIFFSGPVSIHYLAVRRTAVRLPSLNRLLWLTPCQPTHCARASTFSSVLAYSLFTTPCN